MRLFFIARTKLAFTIILKTLTTNKNTLKVYLGKGPTDDDEGGANNGTFALG